MRARLAKLSICGCGFPLLDESVQLGTVYEVEPGIHEHMGLICGGCGTVLRDLPAIYVHERGNSMAGFLPAEVFDIDEGAQ